MAAKTTAPVKTDVPTDVEPKEETLTPRRQSIAGSISAETHQRLEDYRWDARLTKAQVLEQAIVAFLDNQEA